MKDEHMLALRHALFLRGVARGLSADRLHDYIDSGLRLAGLARFIDEQKQKIKAAG